MKAPDFWWRPRPTLAARLLSPVGAAYGAVTAARMRRPGAEGPLPVICIGNFTAGGAGKTPTAIAVGELLASFGEHPAFVTRGYGGSLAGPVVVDPACHTAAEVGDEPLLLARHFPTVVARDRHEGACEADRRGATVAVLDDGLQNPSLVKDLALAVVDAASGAGNGLCLPAGPLRAPLDRQFAQAHALVLVGTGEPGARVAALAQARGRPVFLGHLVPEPGAARLIAGRRLLAFAGIGRPEKFFATLADLGAEVVERAAFPDHHAFTEADVADLAARAAAGDLLPVTTEKDAVRLAALSGTAGEFLARVMVLPVALAFEGADRLRDLLHATVVHWRAQNDLT
ncbi:tetraacyldisaccharide 4'-kinase [Chelatococcus sp. SYSU_G07232]|uniref:Tetraacyldisaccharide 4'-kinase n=1 Tax=Chelatococcus albus TaxID=3047466 RepID=A0ABT7ALI6_9HYPH|nr:tetraacyldisaccharide 4'-kinase [Chelatococcus sp. SYSU_G07232]MDJ1160223.1 tetraacyldisaccharide 4'-kinase [Chelatococcus sp. SYSU_G07232]